MFGHFLDRIVCRFFPIENKWPKAISSTDEAHYSIRKTVNERRSIRFDLWWWWWFPMPVHAIHTIQFLTFLLFAVETENWRWIKHDPTNDEWKRETEEKKKILKNRIDAKVTFAMPCKLWCNVMASTYTSSVCEFIENTRANVHIFDENNIQTLSILFYKITQRASLIIQRFHSEHIN